MLLSARMLTDVQIVNSFEYVTVVTVTQGDTANIYFQLIDSSVDLPTEGFSPPGRRFCPAAGSTLTVVMDSVFDNIKVTRSAVQAYPTLDASIWYVPLLASDTITGTVSFRFTLTQSGVVTRGSLQPALNINPQQSFC